VTEATTPLFPFGFGLSYGNFTLEGTLETDARGPLPRGAEFSITALVSLRGPAGKVVLQVYASQDVPTKFVALQAQLLCFTKVFIPADTARVPVTVRCRVDVRMLNGVAGRGAARSLPSPPT